MIDKKNSISIRNYESETTWERLFALFKITFTEQNLEYFKRESVKKKLSSSISDRLLASMLYPATGILNNELCSPTDLSTICIKALGYRYSTPDLISSLPKTRLDYLLRSHLNARKPIELGPLFLPFGSALNNIKYFEDII